MKNFTKKDNKYFKYSVNLLTVVLLVFVFLFSLFSLRQGKSYTLFIEFSDAYGLKIGTSINYKGVKIGYISRINICHNKVIVLVNIKNLNILLPRESLFEANQIGLFNDRVVDITPIKNYHLSDLKKNNHSYLNDQYYIKPNSYVKGYKGINYDDLIRATTRISQRFDDPRFFNLFYILLQNSIEISNDLSLIVHTLSSFVTYIFYALHISIFRFYF